MFQVSEQKDDFNYGNIYRRTDTPVPCTDVSMVTIPYH
jgi:hypothetical protein